MFVFDCLFLNQRESDLHINRQQHVIHKINQVLCAGCLLDSYLTAAIPTLALLRSQPILGTNLNGNAYWYKWKPGYMEGLGLHLIAVIFICTKKLYF